MITTAEKLIKEKYDTNTIVREQGEHGSLFGHFISKNENYYAIVKDNTVSIYKLDNLFLLRE
jgi:hypothetical protein